MFPDRSIRCDPGKELSWWVESRFAAARARCAASPSLVDRPRCCSVRFDAGSGVATAIGAAADGSTFGGFRRD
ncbi:hypothetical protein SynA1528_00602 [Synechococcus sp. A15-28]|nr:hypothetical protein SynA1528_00602 [Synechococcus sp. A15-28]